MGRGRHDEQVDLGQGLVDLGGKGPAQVLGPGVERVEVAVVEVAPGQQPRLRKGGKLSASTRRTRAKAWERYGLVEVGQAGWRTPWW